MCPHGRFSADGIPWANSVVRFPSPAPVFLASQHRVPTPPSKRYTLRFIRYAPLSLCHPPNLTRCLIIHVAPSTLPELRKELAMEVLKGDLDGGPTHRGQRVDRPPLALCLITRSVQISCKCFARSACRALCIRQKNCEAHQSSGKQLSPQADCRHLHPSDPLARHRQASVTTNPV
jgi:hypothetical protein